MTRTTQRATTLGHARAHGHVGTKGQSTQATQKNTALGDVQPQMARVFVGELHAVIATGGDAAKHHVVRGALRQLLDQATQLRRRAIGMNPRTL